MELNDAFNRDNLLHDKFKQLITDNGIEVVIETGTYHGRSTKAFAEMGVEVHSVDNNQGYLDIAREYLKDTSARLYMANSPEFLNALLPRIKDQKILLFLDAHWEHYCPLLDELKEIAAAGIKPIIAIHDFKVPNKDFGFDVYKGQPFNYEWIKPYLESIYGTYKHYYNTEANGSRRGVIFIEPTRT